MSSTSNIQNLLVNVFRPTVAYDPSTGYVPKVNLCNVDSISAKSLSVTTFGLGDSNGNIFIGSNAGGTSSNTNNTVLGFAAGSGMANTTSSVYIGNVAGIGAQGASNVIGIGKEARGAGTSNIYIGSTTGSSNASSANNILIGHGIDYSNQVISNTLQIGRPGSLVIQGNLANKQVGINTAPAYGLDVCGDFSFHNSNGSFTYALDSSGDTQIDFRSSNVGKKAIMNVVGDVYGQSFYGAFSGSITTPSVTMGSGSITAPSYSFSNDTSTGFYYSFAPTFLGVTVRGCNSMTVNTTGVGIGKTATTQLDVSGTTTSSNLIIPGYARNAAAPTTWDISGGNMFLQSNLKLQTITATGDISATGTIYGSFVSTGLTTSNIYVPGFIRNTAVGFNLDISGGNISNSGTTRSSNFVTSTASSNSIGGVVISNSNIFTGTGANNVGGVSLNNSNITTFGRFSNLDSTSNRIGGVTISNSFILSNLLLESLVVRDALTPTTYDISGGNISNSGTITSSNIRVGSGTVSVPSYAFSTDTSLGLYRVGANQLGFATAGVQRLTMSNNGIMFSSNGAAGTPLISTTGFSSTGFYFANNAQPAICQGSQEITRWNGAGMFTSVSGTTTTPSIAWYPEATGFSKPALGRIAFLTNGSEKMTLSNSNVGIGTNAPLSLFHLGKGNYSSPANGTDGTAFGITFGSSNYTEQARILCTDRTTSGGRWTGVLSFHTATNTGGGANTLERMRIDGDGLVGIGTSVPSYQLDISTAVSNASINMSTWPRTSMSNTYYGSGTTRSNAAVIYTTNTSIDSNLVTVASNSGTYFTINKSGIYSIVAFIVGSTGGTYDAWIDTCTNITHSGAGSDTTIIVGKTGFNGEGRFTLTYSGYLPSNANLYYKTKISANMSSITSARLHITFLQETPTYTGFLV